MKIIREKNHRLDKKFYESEKIVSFVVCIKDRNKAFLDKYLFEEFKKILLEEAKKFETEVLIYLFMPDHLHLILKGESEDSEYKINKYVQTENRFLVL